jgi:hypothetical protein
MKIYGTSKAKIGNKVSHKNHNLFNSHSLGTVPYEKFTLSFNAYFFLSDETHHRYVHSKLPYYLFC